MSRNLVTSLLDHGRIETTEAKGKELRRWVERVITTAKNDNVAARRAVDAIVEDREVTERLFTRLLPRMKDRTGGYTRVLKIGPRQGDGALMVLVELVDDAFDARYSARARLYAYRIRQALPRGAYQRQYAWGLHDELDLATMQAAGQRLEGTHDFRAFGRSPRPGGHTVRRIYDITVNGSGDWVTIAVSADAFLYGMVRRIAGALVDIGRRKRPLEWIDELINGSTVGLRLAPPQGLVQVGVEY